MSRKLSDLDPAFYPKACELIALAAERGIALMIIFTGRTQAEQDELYAQGRTKPGQIVTWTRDSKHVMKPKSLAIDVCPYQEYLLNGPDKLQWDTKNPVWQTIGQIGESLGLKWGVFLKGKTERTDLGHFEFVSR